MTKMLRGMLRHSLRAALGLAISSLGLLAGMEPSFAQGVSLPGYATPSRPGLVRPGAVDAVNGRAHVYAYNVANTWSARCAGQAAPPVGGSVTVSGLPDGQYVVVERETAGAALVGASEAHSVGGSLVIPISGLPGGVAYKAYPQAYFESNVATIMLP